MKDWLANIEESLMFKKFPVTEAFPKEREFIIKKTSEAARIALINPFESAPIAIPEISGPK